MKNNLAILFTIIAVATIAALALSSFLWFRQSSVRQTITALEDVLHTAASSVSADLASGDLTAAKRYLTLLREELGFRFTLVAKNGKVLYDSDNEPATMNNHADRAEILLALSKGASSSVRISPTMKRWFVYASIRLDLDSGTFALRAARELASVNAGFSELFLWLSAILLPFLGAGIFIFIRHGHIADVRLAGYSASIRSFASGKYAPPEIPVRRIGYFDDLAQAIEQTGHKLETEIESLQKDKNELGAIVDAIGEGLLVLDNEGMIRSSNDNVRRILGIHDTEKIEGRYFWEIVRDSALSNFLKSSVGTEKEINREVTVGELICSCHVSPVSGFDATAVLLYDITPLRTLDYMKREFIAAVSHELNTPLTAIKGFLENIRCADPESEHWKEVVERNADRLVRIVRDLVSLEKMNAAPDDLQFETFPARELMDEVSLLFGGQANKKGLTVDFSVLPEVMIYGDRLRLGQMVINLVDNAIRYSDAGTISLAIEDSDGSVKITVGDMGVGIPEKELDKIFEPFYVVNKARSRETGGTGLGLSIVKRIVTMHKGTISVSSKPGKGTVFSVSLPEAVTLSDM